MLFLLSNKVFSVIILIYYRHEILDVINVPLMSHSYENFMYINSVFRQMVNAKYCDRK
jgi:hypothetical protein